MSYIYAIMWLAIGLYLCIAMGKENKLMIILSLYFFFSAIWWFIDAVSGIDLFAMPYSLIFRGVSAAALIVAVGGYCFQKKRSSKVKENPENNDNDKKE